MKKVLLVSCLIFFQFLAGCGSNENKPNDDKISEQTKQELKEKAEQNNKNIQFFPVRVVSDNSGYSVHEIDDKGKVLACNTLKKIAPEIVNYFLEVFY